MKNKKILIVGLSNNSKLAAYYFQNDSEFEVVGFVVDKEYKTCEDFYDLPVYCFDEDLISNFPPSEFNMFVAVGYSGMNKVRQSLYLKVKQLGYSLPNYISSKCNYFGQSIGDNNFILEDNTIQPFVKIGSNNVLWSGNHICHDVEIGDHNFFTSHVVVSGFTKIKNNCFLGVNSTLRDGIVIEDFTLIAASATIMKDTIPEGVYLGPKTIMLDKKSTEINIS